MNRRWFPMFMGLLLIAPPVCPAIASADDLGDAPAPKPSEPFGAVPPREVERLFKLTAEKGVVNDSDEDPAEFSADWDTVEASLASTRPKAAPDILNETLGSLATDRGDDPYQVVTAEDSMSLVPRYVITVAVLLGLLVGTRLGVWRFINRSLFASAARRKGAKVKLRRRTRPADSEQDIDSEATSGPQRVRRRRRRKSHGAASRPQAVYPDYQPENDTREYILSEVVITTNVSVKQLDEGEQFLSTSEE